VKWDGGIRNTISALLLWQAGIEDPFPCRALREVMEYIPEAADPDSPVSQYGELICGCVREGGGEERGQDAYWLDSRPDCSLLSAATFHGVQLAGGMRLQLSNARRERGGRMQDPRHGAQAWRRIWNWLVMIRSMARRLCGYEIV
jgi:hypothetical protein